MFYYDFTGMAKQEDVRTDLNKEWLRKVFEEKRTIWWHDLMSNGIAKCMGWAYDFKNDLKHYVYKRYGQWVECYAPNKTLLRKNVYGRVDRIVELVD